MVPLHEFLQNKEIKKLQLRKSKWLNPQYRKLVFKQKQKPIWNTNKVN